MAHLDTLALGQTDPWLFAPYDEDICLACSKGIVDRILNVHNVETAVVTLTMRDHPNSAHVSSTSGHCNHCGIEADVVGNLACRQVDFDRIVDLDGRVWIAYPGPTSVSLT